MKEKKQTLPEKAKQYQKILETLQEGYLLVDQQGHVCETNAAYCKMMGYTRGELYNMNLTDLRTDISSQELLDLLGGIAEGDSKHFESNHRKKDGRILDLNVSAAAIERDDKIFIAGLVWDITEENEAKQKREESEQRFKSLFEHNPHSVFYMDLEGNYLGVNSKMEELTGYSEDELLTLDFTPLITEKDLEITQKHFEKAAERNIQEYEITGVTKQGTEKPVRITNFPMIIGDEITGVFGIAEDITERKQAEQKREESEKRFKSLFEHNPHPVYYFDLEGNFKEVNQKLVEFTGCSREELLQKGFADFVDEKDLEETQKHFQEAIEGVSGEYEILVWVRDGVKKEVRVTKFPMYVNEEIVGVYGILQDVTEQKQTQRKLKQSEQKWQHLVEKSPLPVQVTKDGNILYINKAGAELYGAKSYKDLIGESIYAFNTTEMQQKIRERVRRMNEGQSVDSYHQHKIINKNGNERFVEVHSRPISYQGEQAIQSVYRDITEQKVAEQKLRESEDRWHKIVEENPKPVQITVDAEIVFINKSGVDLYEAESRKQLMGKSVLDFTHPEVLEQVKQRKYKLENNLSVEPVFENKMITLSGNERFIDVHSIAINYKGQNAIQTVIYDVTERKLALDKIKESENLKSAILETALDAIVTIDHKGNILEFNKVAERMFGYKQEEVSGKEMGETIMLSLNKESLYKGMEHYLKTGESKIIGRRIQMKAMRADGSVFPIEITVNKITGTDPPKFTGFIRDITERQHKERQLLESLEEKKIMLQEIHHRVKNNMAVISGLLELQSLSTDDTGVQEILRESQMRIYSMAMIHEKLYASESLAEISFDEYAKELVEVIKNSMGDINNEVTVRYRMDPVQLNITQAIPCALILNELVVNCYKHAFKDNELGSILITFTKKGTDIIFSVKDNGRGLPDDFKIEEQQSLGMTIIKTLTKQLEAGLSIKQNKNRQGTCFIISFSEDN